MKKVAALAILIVGIFAALPAYPSGAQTTFSAADAVAIHGGELSGRGFVCMKAGAVTMRDWSEIGRQIFKVMEEITKNETELRRVYRLYMNQAARAEALQKSGALAVPCSVINSQIQGGLSSSMR